MRQSTGLLYVTDAAPQRDDIFLMEPILGFSQRFRTHPFVQRRTAEGMCGQPLPTAFCELKHFEFMLRLHEHSAFGVQMGMNIIFAVV